MSSANMIPVHQFCIHHKIDQSFIFSLQESGLIEFMKEEEIICVTIDQLPQLEKIIRLYEMDINLEGIETITHLLNRVNNMQKEISRLNNKLSRYEE